MQEKRRAVNRLLSEVTAETIASGLGNGKSAVGDEEKSNRNRKMVCCPCQWKYIENKTTTTTNRKIMLKGKYKEVEEALYLWHQHLRGNSLPITGRISQEKALRVSELLGEDENCMD